MKASGVGEPPGARGRVIVSVSARAPGDQAAITPSGLTVLWSLR